MLRVLIVACYAILCLRYGAWRRWREYYPTFLYALIGDLAYNFLFYDKTLWAYDKLVSHTFSDFLIGVVVFPCAITLFLTHYPAKGVWKQALYILLWTGANTAIEFMSYKMGYIVYLNGWNILWSVALYLVAFPLVRLHYLRPQWVWPISFACAYATMLIFGVPLIGLK